MTCPVTTSRLGTDRGSHAARESRCWVVGLLLLLAVSPGCQAEQQLPAKYGKRRGLDYENSVNGTGVLSRMFEQKGYRVSSWRRLSPKLYDADVIVWAPDRFAPPDEDARAFFERWFYDSSRERTLVYIGRDYDAEIEYWRHMVDKAPPEQVQEVRRRLAEARSQHQEQRADMPLNQPGRWMVTNGNRPRRQVSKLSGPWSRDIDPSKTEIFVQGRLDIPTEAERQSAEAKAAKDVLDWTDEEDFDNYEYDYETETWRWQDSPPEFEVLLDSDQGPLVYEVSDPNWASGRVIIVQNGSFLLNLPLVNHQHRELASRLVDDCGYGDVAMFVESGPRAIEIRESDKPSPPNGKEAFTTWPLNFVLLHAAVLGILYCLSKFPIFGTPRQLEEADHSDFRRHINALGQLFERAGAVTYVQQRLAHYQQNVRRESGVSHAAAKSPPPSSE